MGNKLLLLVDDEEDWLLLLERFLVSENFSVLTARNCREALEIVSRDRPNCVIVDAKIGEENGGEICRRIKASPELRGIPVIMLSGGIDAAQDCGPDACICKSDGLGCVLATLRKVLAEISKKPGRGSRE